MPTVLKAAPGRKAPRAPRAAPEPRAAPVHRAARAIKARPGRRASKAAPGRKAPRAPRAAQEPKARRHRHARTPRLPGRPGDRIARTSGLPGRPGDRIARTSGLPGRPGDRIARTSGFPGRARDRIAGSAGCSGSPGRAPDIHRLEQLLERTPEPGSLGHRGRDLFERHPRRWWRTRNAHERCRAGHLSTCGKRMDGHVLRHVIDNGWNEYHHGLGRMCQLNQPAKWAAACGAHVSGITASGALGVGRKVLAVFHAGKASP